jgi:pimeloyl-ACP methyl ester carboxylesterase
LPDGRRLAYIAHGPEHGPLVIYLHGAVGTPQCVCSELQAAIDDLGMRYVMVSRPGFGASDPQPGRTLLGFADDVAALADHLGRERFAVAGVSAGGPYALACAHALPERVAAAAVVSCMSPDCPPDLAPGISPPLRFGLRLLRRLPRACGWTGDRLLTIARRRPGLVAGTMLLCASPADRRLLRDPEARQLAVASFLAAAAGGVSRMIGDYLLCAGRWGFEPRDVRGHVHLWHGVQDALVPVDQALQMAAALPHVQTALDPDEAHFFYRRRMREILAELVAAVELTTPAAVEAAHRSPCAVEPVHAPPRAVAAVHAPPRAVA